MDRILKKIEALDQTLASIMVSGDSVISMASARMAVKDIYENIESASKELNDLRYFRDTVNKEKEDGR